MEKRIGIMGAGVVADYGHAPAIKDAAGITPVAVFDPRKKHVESFAQRHGIPHAADTVDGFFATDLDAVLVSSPAPTHLMNVKACVERNLPVLCEKPLAMDEADSLEMVELCEQAGVPLFCGFCYRFSQSALDIKRMIRDGAIGQVRSLRLIYNWDCHGKYCQDPETGAWQLDQRRIERMEEGGPLFDCGTHQIDLARWWLDAEVTAFDGRGAWVEVDDYQAPDHVWLHLDLQGEYAPQGAHACIEMSYSYGHTTRDKFSEFVYELIGTDGMIRYDRNHSQFELRDGQKTERLHYHEEKNFRRMWEDYAQFLHHGEPGDLATARDALEVTRLARNGTEKAIAARPKLS